MGMPKGMGYQGKKLWQSVTAEFGDLEEEPDKLRILYDACKTADLVDELEKGRAGEPLMVLGSARQKTISPLISELRYQRGLLAQLIARLNFAPREEDDDE
ncbi:Uncharacterised protein [Mycolicibacterium fortuitum]|uniref:Uncharacterized protein n=1 Tax=Mycolicibacterium fortuitum TaxID=1766 RepID=A0A378V0L3_MYCFO|nr:Uncharacterised protein [Mycolicibacterium fortuitum]